ncbi:FIST N-terminal domain-containing protein [Sulfurimonas sp. HSL-1656]|uniref:FIST N-terminal domain-containing protein n=1 Tax=Thiomicrolovo subterrani TaxID=3131934 RepID=UPI0031F9CEF8
MIQFNHIYSDKKGLELALAETGIDFDAKTILVQMFSSLQEREAVSGIAATVLSLLPGATLIGASTVGEIVGGVMTEKQTVLGISVFEKSRILAVSDVDTESFSLGKKLGESLCKDEVRCIITFADGIQHGSDFLEAFRAANCNNIPIAGGMAGDLLRFKHTYTIHQERVFEGGAVGVALIGEALEVFQDLNMGWRPVGKEMTITRAKKNRVYTIDGQPTTELYREVLGEAVVRELPASAMGFPLIKQSGGIPIARSMIGAFEDGSVLYAGNLSVGDRVQFGIGSADLVNSYIPGETIPSEAQTLQAAFIYSCSGRKQFLGKQLEVALDKIDSFAPACGFFTYGEFYSSASGAELLNITSTILFLREKGTQNQRFDSPLGGRKQQRAVNAGEKAVFHLIDYNTKALEEQSRSLAAAKRSLQEHIDGINDVLIVSKTDRNGIITYVNPNFERISGYSRGELIGQSHNIVRSPNTPDSLFEEMWNTITAGQIWHGSFANRRKDGTDYYVKSSIIPLHDERNRISEFFAIREDITDLIETQLAYKREHTFTQKLLNNDESIILIIRNGVTEKVNQTFFRLFPFDDLEDLMNSKRCINSLFIPKEGFLSAGGRRSWYQKLLDEPNRIHKALMEDREGTVRTFSVRARQVKFENDEYIFCSFNDVTELEEARIQAEKAEEAQATFLANMSHEIRTPMNGILGFTGMLKKSGLNAQQLEYLDIIERSSATLLEIINDVLDFSKIKSHHMVLEHIPVDLYAELNTAFSLMQPAALQKQLNYASRFDPEMDAVVLGDPTRLKQIIINLLSNAIKFTPASGEVQLRTEVLEIHPKEGQLVRFVVEDNGIGIQKEKQERIFSPFTQANESTTREFGGTGLGLSICASLVEAMGSELKLYSKEGKGTVFYFDLMLASYDAASNALTEADESEAAETGTEHAVNSGMKVLVAEDLEMNRLLVQLLLSQYGIDAVFVENGQEVLDKMEKEAFDLILMDVNMPVMNGLDATRRIRERLGSSVPIIALTANAMEGDREKFLQSGMNGYLTKPLEEKKLEAVLRQYS